MRGKPQSVAHIREVQVTRIKPCSSCRVHSEIFANGDGRRRTVHRVRIYPELLANYPSFNVLHIATREFRVLTIGKLFRNGLSQGTCLLSL